MVEKRFTWVLSKSFSLLFIVRIENWTFMSFKVNTNELLLRGTESISILNEKIYYLFIFLEWSFIYSLSLSLSLSLSQHFRSQENSMQEPATKQIISIDT